MSRDDCRNLLPRDACRDSCRTLHLRDVSRVNVMVRQLVWKNVDKVPPLYTMCILMLWMASARYYVHTTTTVK